MSNLQLITSLKQRMIAIGDMRAYSPILSDPLPQLFMAIVLAFDQGRKIEEAEFVKNAGGYIAGLPHF